MRDQTELFGNDTKKALQRGERVVGTMSSVLGCPEALQFFALSGFDYVIIDSEHSPYDISTLRHMVSVARLSGITPFIRVPDAQYHLIARSLDTGALGVMVPRVETKKTVEEIVAAVKYPPVGRRGCGAVDLQNDFLPITVPEHIARANEETLIIIQIESRAALECIDELVSVPGVDVALIGPVDFSISLGIPGQFQHETFIRSVTRVIEACQKAEIAAGTHVPDFETVRFWAERGMRCLTCSADIGLLRSAIEQLGQKLVTLKGAAGL